MFCNLFAAIYKWMVENLLVLVHSVTVGEKTKHIRILRVVIRVQQLFDKRLQATLHKQIIPKKYWEKVK